MEIKFMSKLEKAQKLLGSGIRKPYNESQIKDLEEQFNKGKKFPRAFREYLFLAGEYQQHLRWASQHMKALKAYMLFAL